MVKKSPQWAFNDSFNLGNPSQKMVNDFNYAARVGKDAEVEAFLNKHPHAVNAMADNRMTALMVAAANGNKSTVELLLKKGADPDVETAEGRTALRFATREGQRYIEVLLRQASEEKKQLLAEKPAQKKINKFCEAARAGDDEKVAKFLDKYPYAVDAKAESGLTALMYAAANGNMSTVKLLLENNAKADEKTAEGSWTALMYAKREGQRDVAELLEQKTQEQAAERKALADTLKKGGARVKSPGRKP
ncbi:MAG: ankyrin repeat domain-containing protein [Alphaproteobacteria bacterium]|nr:ankyrin repeat domain-containing protein [Alphaproteobacteria bacterium]